MCSYQTIAYYIVAYGRFRDDGFEVPSPSARKALISTKRLVTWCDDPANSALLSTFAVELVSLQGSCF